MAQKEEDAIILKGIKVNNLQNVDVVIPKNQLVVVTGLSGSGKSSLVFDTLYAEGQRRYVESLNAYARQFLGKINKPAVDEVIGIPPAIAVGQRSLSRNPYSTVGTMTEIYEYIKLLYARLGKTYSHISGKLVKRDSVTDVCTFIFGLDQSKKIMILAPIVYEKKNLKKVLEILLNQGFSRLCVNDEILQITDALQMSFKEKDKLYLLVDRCTLEDSAENHSRIADSVETAYFHGDGKCQVRIYDKDNNVSISNFSNKFEEDGIVFRKPNVNMFAFSNSYGACPTCKGIGEIQGINPDLVIPDKRLSVYEGAVVCWHGDKMSEYQKLLIKTAKYFDFNIHTPINQLTEKQYHDLWYGNEYFPGVVGFFDFIEKNAYKIQYRVMLSRYRGKTTCPDCNGFRLAKDAFYVKVADKTIADIVSMPLDELLDFFTHLKFSSRAEKKVADFLLNEICIRISFLCDLGLSYLTLNRLSSTLSGGESQRVCLATSLGSNLVGSLYILDEPSIGLHSVDTECLIRLLKRLRDIGNTVVVVEHDEEIIRSADYVIDVGPLSGRNGGKIVYQGKYDKFLRSKESITSQYLTHQLTIPVPLQRKAWKRKISVNGACINNLKNVNVDIPLGVIAVVTGVSGSGKSSLVKGVLYPNLQREIENRQINVSSSQKVKLVSGDISSLKGVELVDQNPIGRSSRSNPLSYIGVFELVRQLFAEQPLSKARGYKAGFFSFNVQGGRCEACQGEGLMKIKMQFMADVEICCEECRGTGYKDETLEVTVNGKNIYDILQMTVDESIAFFEGLPTSKLVENIIDGLKLMQQVGLGYIQLGQSGTSLSGGEAQRIKLAYYLRKSDGNDHTLFIFDEPTTGLHFHDIEKLYKTFCLLVNHGHSVLIIEHNMEIIKCADWVIDMGEGGGKHGGEIVFAGTPEDLVKCKKSQTAKYLKEKLS